jgi:hypothetical protein
VRQRPPASSVVQVRISSNRVSGIGLPMAARTPSAVARGRGPVPVARRERVTVALDDFVKLLGKCGGFFLG